MFFVQLTPLFTCIVRRFNSYQLPLDIARRATAQPTLTQYSQAKHEMTLHKVAKRVSVFLSKCLTDDRSNEQTNKQQTYRILFYMQYRLST